MTTQKVTASQEETQQCFVSLASAIGHLIDAHEEASNATFGVHSTEADDERALTWHGSTLAHQLADLAGAADAVWADFNRIMQQHATS